MTAAEDQTSLSRAWECYTLGCALLAWERFNAARQYLDQAQQLFSGHEQPIAVLRCQFALLLVDLFQDARPTLEEQLVRVAAHFEAAGLPAEATHVLLHQAILLDILGRPESADAVLAGIKPVLRNARPGDAARWLYIYGSVGISIGDYERAEAALLDAEQSFAALHMPVDRAKCWFQQGWSALRQEKLEAALAHYQRAEQRFNDLDLPLRMAFAAKGLGLLFTRMGRYDHALRSLLHAMHIFAETQRADQVGACNLNLGNLYYYIGLWDIALSYYWRAELLYSSRGVVRERHYAQRNRAMVYQAQAHYDAARELLVSVEHQAQIIGDDNLIAETWADLAELLANEGCYEAAMAQFDQARDRFMGCGNVLGVADCAMKQGWLAFHHGELEVALQLFTFAAPAVVHHPYDRWRTDYGLARCAELYGDIAGALAYYHAASATVAELRGRLVSEVTSSSLYAQAAQLHTDSLRCATTHGAVTDLLQFSEYQRALVLQRARTLGPLMSAMEHQQPLEGLRAQINELLRRDLLVTSSEVDVFDATLTAYSHALLTTCHATPLTLPAASPFSEIGFDLEQLRSQLNHLYDTEWTVLVYSECHQTLLISVVTPHDLTLVQRRYDESLQHLIDQASQARYRYYTYYDLPYRCGQTTQLWDGLRALADQLIPPAVRVRLQPAHRLLIVPFGALHLLAWGTLRLDGQWLLEQAIVHVMPSLTLCQSLTTSLAAEHTRALLVGCSVFDAPVASLPAVIEELTSVAAYWPGESERLDDTQATRAALLERSANGTLRSYGLLHIASHAQLLPKHGIAAHIKLWDDKLWLSEVASLRLDGVLVTLSACEGALAEILPGEEILSLSWAFLAAGARGVIASLWAIDDRETLQFMDLFYAALRQQRDVGRALAHAQRSMMAAEPVPGDREVSPLAWGGFVLTGGCQALW